MCIHALIAYTRKTDLTCLPPFPCYLMVVIMFVGGAGVACQFGIASRVPGIASQVIRRVFVVMFNGKRSIVCALLKCTLLAAYRHYTKLVTVCHTCTFTRAMHTCVCTCLPASGRAGPSSRMPSPGEPLWASLVPRPLLRSGADADEAPYEPETHSFALLECARTATLARATGPPVSAVDHGSGKHRGDLWPRCP